MPSATAILDRFLHHAEIVAITGKSYRLRNKTEPPADAEQHASKPAKMHAGKTAGKARKNRRSRNRTTKTKSLRLANRSEPEDYAPITPAGFKMHARGRF